MFTFSNSSSGSLETQANSTGGVGASHALSIMHRKLDGQVGVRVITSFFVPEDSTELPQPVAAALRHHARNPLVAEVHVLTECDDVHITRLISGIADMINLTVLRCKQRPSFAELFCYASQLFQRDPLPVAIMNADVSFASEDDIVRARSALESAARGFVKAVLALTRHDRVAGEWKLPVRQRDGLPNTLSADCWLLSGPIDLPAADFYSLGHNNCDLMLIYDLVVAGVHVLNPCLDVAIYRHKDGQKGRDFYEAPNSSKDKTELLLRHAAARCNEPFQILGVSWATSQWLEAGYTPEPYSSLRKKIYVLLPANPRDDLLQEAKEIEVFSKQNNCDLFFIVETGGEDYFPFLKPVFTASRRIYLQLLAISAKAFMQMALSDGLEGANCCAFTTNPYFLRKELVQMADAVVLDMSARPTPEVIDAPCLNGDYNVWAFKRYGPAATGCAQRQAMCSLITSLFKAQAYIRKFLENSSSIYAYEEQVDHLFFISSPANTEVECLLSHLSKHTNSLVVRWTQDPGLYACWNQGLELACTSYVSNANVDDLRNPLQIWKLIDQLEADPGVCVAASTIVPFKDHHKANLDSIDKSQPWYADHAGVFGYELLAQVSNNTDGSKHLEPHNLPHCMPVWRRSLHREHGYFDEERYGTFADWAFWLHVFRRGGKGYLLPEPLSFYFVNPVSHNRRGKQLANWHYNIEQEHLESFCLRLSGQQVLSKQAKRPSWLNAEQSESRVVPKLDLHGRAYAYGQHRNTFSNIIDHLKPLHLGENGVLFLPFIERYFVWGNALGEASSTDPRAIDRDWIGILHCPFDTPLWFEPKLRPENFFRTPLWEESFARCRGLITLSEDLAEDVRFHYPHLPVHSLLHPTAFDGKQFDLDAYLQRPRVIQAGDWLRKLQAIYQLRAPNHHKVMLFKSHTRRFMQSEIDALGDFRNGSVEEKEFVSNKEYDDLLSSSVVLCLLYASAANNLVLECLVRNTPIIINPLPSVVEYLGPSYPLYAATLLQAEEQLQNSSRIAAAASYLKDRVACLSLSYKSFCDTLAASVVYKHL
jgi:hypothetical protein